MTRTDRTGALTQNQCLYLSLAAAVRPRQAEVHEVAGSLRAQIEAAVRRDRPHWAEQDLLGQEVGAFADFLTWGLQAAPLLRDRAVAVYDSRTGAAKYTSPGGAMPPRPASWPYGSAGRTTDGRAGANQGRR